jgi:hypothetical protein
MREELYADGIGEITVTGSIVRIDFVSLSATQKDASNNPQAVVRQRIIMPGDAFANAVNLMQQALNGLADAGLVQRATSPAPGPGAAAPNGNASPNFS